MWYNAFNILMVASANVEDRLIRFIQYNTLYTEYRIENSISISFSDSFTYPYRDAMALDLTLTNNETVVY